MLCVWYAWRKKYCAANIVQHLPILMVGKSQIAKEEDWRRGWFPTFFCQNNEGVTFDTIVYVFRTIFPPVASGSIGHPPHS